MQSVAVSSFKGLLIPRLHPGMTPVSCCVILLAWATGGHSLGVCRPFVLSVSSGDVMWMSEGCVELALQASSLMSHVVSCGPGFIRINRSCIEQNCFRAQRDKNRIAFGLNTILISSYY